MNEAQAVPQLAIAAALEGAANFRDFGGYAISDGGHVARGSLFRSNRLSVLTNRDRTILDGLGIRTVFDLRAPHEREADRTCWTHDTLVTRSYRPGHKRSLVEMSREYPPDVAGARRLMAEFYAAMPQALAHAFGAIIRDLADGAAPCIVHCSAGKDRTGVAAALILSALGVDRDNILADFALTDARIRPEQEMARALTDARQAQHWNRYPPDAAAVMLAADPAYLTAAFAAIDAAYGSLGGYFDEALNVTPATIAELRRRLIIPGEEQP